MEESFIFNNKKTDLKSSVNVKIEKFKEIEDEILKSLEGTQTEFDQDFDKHFDHCKKKHNRPRLELDRNFEMNIEKQFELFVKSSNTSEFPELETLKATGFPDNMKNKYLKFYGNFHTHFKEPLPKHQFLSTIETGNEKLSKVEDLVVGKSIIVSVNVYQSNYKYVKGMKNPPKVALSQALLLSGRNTLADLRDMIFCEHDHIANVQPPYEILKEIFPSSLFYICDSFYIDTRKPENKDYSKVIKEWAKGKNIPVGDTYSMENTFIEDMTFKMCYPELFLHLGDCEHFITIGECRLLHPDDCKISSYYPMMTAIVKRRTRLCILCNKVPMEFIVVKSKKTFEEKSSVCRSCYLHFFVVDGKQIEPNVKCFLYTERSVVLAKLK